jgi:hypothetical protein
MPRRVENFTVRLRTSSSGCAVMTAGLFSNRDARA